ncbi:polyA-binding protein interacting protein 2 [Lycorma delicatula]|uniref:polyA-binding protein interacting protein 2 n=1 Tax=Lycorma delicatula TaxID=130591 RepID=UPI003F5131B7
MKMKLPTNTSSNGYYSHESSISAYIPDGSDNGHQDDLDSPTIDGDFSEYMWMENEEEFDKQVMQQLEEEALMEQCIEAMLEDEREIRYAYYNNQNNHHNNVSQQPALIIPQPWSDSSLNPADLCNEMESLRVQDHDELAKQSTLNPNAAEFIPQQRLAISVALVEKAT